MTMKFKHLFLHRWKLIDTFYFSRDTVFEIINKNPDIDSVNGLDNLEALEFGFSKLVFRCTKRNCHKMKQKYVIGNLTASAAEIKK
jgi:hypothetical protein